MFHFGAGVLLCLITWAGLRWLVGAPLAGRRGRGGAAAIALDMLPIAAGFLLILLPTARPILSGLAILSLGIGMGVADRVKRVLLDEPVVFADRAELIEVVRHPRLYLAFIGMGRMALAAAACVAAVVGMIWLESPLWPVGVPAALLLAGIAVLIGRAMFVIPTWPPLLRRLGDAYERFEPSRDPAEDARRFGLLATCIVHATLARLERPGRQAAAQARVWPALAQDAGPIVIIQGESFVDARRLHLELAGALSHFAELRSHAFKRGRLSVPCWGANTIRSELAVLTGLGTEAIGLDRFNPYEHFARVPLPSLAAAARAAGYFTVCLHPYNREFYYRDQVMPLLGFDRFVGVEGFAGAAHHGPYVGDRAVAERAAALIREHGPRIFLFAITMENHGPWDAGHDSVAPAPLPAEWAGLRDAQAIGRWLAHLEETDAMIPILREAMGAVSERGCLLFYGDHQPSLTGPFHAVGAADRRTDYAMWCPGLPPGLSEDLSAEQLAAELLKALGSA